MVGLILFLAVLVLVFFLKLKKFKGDIAKTSIEFYAEYKDTFKKLFDLAFDVVQDSPKDRTNAFLARIYHQWKGGYFNTDLRGLKKVLQSELAHRVTNSVDNIKVDEFLKRLEEEESKGGE